MRSAPPASRRHHLSRPLPSARFPSAALPPRSTVYVVERLGRFSRVLHSTSDSPLLPLVDKVVAAYTTRRVQQTTPASGVLALAARRLQVHVHAAWTVAVLDPKKLAYRIADVDRCIHMLVHVRIRDALAALPPHALHSLAAPPTKAAIADAVRQNVDETAHKFGVACPALTISAIRPVNDQHPAQHHTPDPPPERKPHSQKPRSLNLEEPNPSPPIPSDPNEFDTVLPELPAHNQPAKLPLPPTFDDDSSDDPQSRDDSSTENRPENTPASPKEPHVRPARPPPVSKDVLYAPPPSPSHLDPQTQLDSPDTLPNLISRVLTRKDHPDQVNQVTTDSSYDDDLPPPLPPSPKPLPPSPPPPPPDDKVLNPDFTPDLAKFLDGLPPTPPTDLPSTDTSSDTPQDGDRNVEAQDAQDETVSMDTHFSRIQDGDDQDDSVEDPEVHQESLPQIPLQNMKENPFDAVKPPESSEQPPESQEQPPESPEQQQFPLTPTNSASAQSHPGDEDSDALSNKAVLDKDIDTIDDLPSSTLLPESSPSVPSTLLPESSPSVPSTLLPESAPSAPSTPLPEPSPSVPVSSSINREPRRRRQQLPTASVFQSVIGKAERAIKSATSDFMEAPMRLINAQSNTQRITGAADAVRMDGRGDMLPRHMMMNGRNPATRPAPRRIDVERKRSVPKMTEYQPAGNRTPTPMARQMYAEHYPPEPWRMPPPIAMAVPFQQPEGFRPSPSGYPTFAGISDNRRDGIAFRDGMDAAHHLEDDPNHRMMLKKGGDADERRKRREGSALRSRKEEEILSSKEHARREELMDTLDTIEKSQGDNGPAVDDFIMDENRDTWAEAGSDSDQDVFFDAQDVIAPNKSSEPLEPRHSSRRRQKSRHARKGSRHEDGYNAERSSSEDECPHCAHRHYEVQSQEESRSRSGRSRSKAESARRRVREDDESDSEGFSDHHSSRSRSRNEQRSGESHRSEHTERSGHSSRDRSHRSKKSSSRERKAERPERSERSERREKSERSERRDKSERPELSEKSAKEHSSSKRSKSGDRKRSHENEKSRSSKKTSHVAEPEQKRREHKSRSKKKHRKPSSSPALEYEHDCPDLKSIYRHRLPDSDSGIDNPIPWYCEGQSAPDDTDFELAYERSSESESNMMDSVQTTTTTYSSYGRRDKNGRRRRAHHNRSVTFLYDDL